MNDRKPYISPPPDADGPYEYYLIAGFRLVRVSCDESGAMIHAEATNRDGVLELAAILTTILKDEDVEEISRQEFIDWCRRAALESRP
jgi:hypothetical protein